MTIDVLVEGKDWGTAEHLYEDTKMRIVRVVIEKGWQCSTHVHAAQSNSFYIVSGILAVVEEPGTKHERRRLLGSGMEYTVSNGVPHCFQSLTRVIAVETYIGTNGRCSRDDIVRSCPGKRIRVDD